MKSNLLNPQESAAKHEENTIKILDFLRTEKYTTSKNIMNLLGFKNIRSAQKILSRLEKKDFVKSHKFLMGSVTIWGISWNGLVEIYDGDVPESQRSFSSSSFSLSTLEHNLSIQEIHAKAKKRGLRIEVGKSLGSKKNKTHIPDAIIFSEKGNLSVEVENHVKSKARISEIIYRYLMEITNGKYSRILYVMPDEKSARHIKNAFYSVDKMTATKGGITKKITIDKDTHLSVFDFVSIENIDGYLDRIRPWKASA